MLVLNGDMISVGNGCRFGQVYYIYKCLFICFFFYMIYLKNFIIVIVVDLFYICFNLLYDLNIFFFFIEFSMIIVIIFVDKLCYLVLIQVLYV